MKELSTQKQGLLIDFTPDTTHNTSRVYSEVKMITKASFLSKEEARWARYSEIQTDGIVGVPCSEEGDDNLFIVGLRTKHKVIYLAYRFVSAGEKLCHREESGILSYKEAELYGLPRRTKIIKELPSDFWQQTFSIEPVFS